MIAKEVMQMGYAYDRNKSGILSSRELASSPDIADKSTAHINTLFSRYVQKHGKDVSFILIANVHCEKSQQYYNSFFDESELGVLEELASAGAVLELGYFAIYDRKRYTDKKDVLRAYEKLNFDNTLNEKRVEPEAVDKDVPKIKRVWANEKERVESKGGSQGQSQDANVGKLTKAPNITSFFRKPA